MLDIDSLNHIVTNSHFVLGASDPGQWVDNGTDTAKNWGGKIATFLGTLCFIAALWFLFKTIATKSKRGFYALLMLAACIVGALLVYGGISFLDSLGNSGYNGVKKIKG